MWDSTRTERDFGGYLAAVIGFAACGGFYAALPHVVVRFLPTQEWSVGDGSVCGFWRYLRILHCEIPAFAGMSCGGMEGCGRI